MTAHASRLAVPCLVVLLAAVPAAAPAQSLADVARSSNTKRKEQPKPGKVYTNGDLRQDITPSAPASAGATTDTTSATTPAPEAPESASADAASSSGGEVHDEKYWKGRMTSAREAVERSTSFAAALQSQINGLTTEFVNRDDPAQRAGIEQRRTKAVAELERVQREIEAAKKGVAAVEEDARKAGVPAGWLR